MSGFTHARIEKSLPLMIALVIVAISFGGLVEIVPLFFQKSTTQHMINPRDLVPESNMPGYPWLARNPADDGLIQKKMSTLRKLGHPYSDEDIAKAPEMLKGRTELDALIAYLQGLGTAIRSAR